MIKAETKLSAGRKGIMLVMLILLSLWMGPLQQNVYAEEPEQEASVRNILLIGTDHRDDSWNGNSDVMIVATINDAKEQIVLTSFMRDLYAEIPGHGTHKLNYAFAVGGAQTLISTLASNYQLDIRNYAVVDFDSMAAVIDCVGGVELTVSDAEVRMINGYLGSMNKSEYALPCGGTYTLNGYQAVAHMRDRYVGNNDYERTQRQRDVLSQIFARTKELDAQQMAKLSMEILAEVEYDFNALELVSLVKELPQLAGYELIENRVPYDGMFYSKNEMLVPDFPATIEKLHQILGDTPLSPDSSQEEPDQEENNQKETNQEGANQ